MRTTSSLYLSQSQAHEPITLAEAKHYLRVDGDMQDSLILRAIEAARTSCEAYLSLRLMPQTWCLSYQNGAPERVEFPLYPIIAIEKILCSNQQEKSVLLPESIYFLDKGSETLVFSQFITAQKVDIFFEVGYEELDHIPGGIIQGILMHAHALYHQRFADLSVPQSALSLYAPYRRSVQFQL